MSLDANSGFYINLNRYKQNNPKGKTDLICKSANIRNEATTKLYTKTNYTVTSQAITEQKFGIITGIK